MVRVGQTAGQSPPPAILASRVQGDLSNDDRATAQTVRLMCRHIQESVNDPLIQAIATACKNTAASNGRAENPGAITAAIWWRVKHGMIFTQDDALIRRLFNEGEQLELLISPRVMVRLDRAEGDCDDFTMMACCLLKACGYPYEIVTVAADHSQPTRYSHVFGRAVLPGGLRVPMDVSHGRFPGWQVPAADTLRIQVWDEQGNPISDQAPRPAKLQGYAPRRGLGAGGDFGGEFGPADTVPPQVVVSSTPSSQPSWWENLAGSLATQWTTIGGRILAPTTIATRDPSGALHLETPGSSPSLLTTFGAGTAGGGSSLLIWGGLAVVAVVVLASMGKGRG